MNIRELKPSDIEEIVSLWHRTKREAYSYLPLEQEHTLEDDLSFFRNTLLLRCEIWVAELDSEVAGFLALSGSYIDRLYVAVDRYRCGLGTALLDFAKELSPHHLSLHTHQKNLRAKAFYEKHQFRPVKFGISPPPESEPDVEYHWP